MVTKESVEKQLKRIHFNHLGWGRTEAKELPNILLADEEIYEVVNGIYEGGFALLVATDVRVLLVDKKPMNYLTVEDLRFDMINEIDYSHRLLGAQIRIATGNKTLKFTSYNQPRLRKLIGHVQHCMAELKKKQNEHQEDQKSHLEQINQQLQAYLLAQHQYQEQLRQHMTQQQSGESAAAPPPEPVRPSPELSDFLFAQSLLAQHQAEQATKQDQPVPPSEPAPIQSKPQPQSDPAANTPLATVPPPPTDGSPATTQMADLYNEGVKEVFGKHQADESAVAPPTPTPPAPLVSNNPHNPLDITALRIAYSKLPMALRNRKFGRPSFHAHSQQPPLPSQPRTAGVR